jgi:hypothetical protein
LKQRREDFPRQEIFADRRGLRTTHKSAKRRLRCDDDNTEEQALQNRDARRAIENADEDRVEDHSQSHLMVLMMLLRAPPRPSIVYRNS